jgi:hypothetical protein
MSQPITVKIDVTKINKDHLYIGKKGKYLTVFLYPTPNDEYGNDYRATQDIPKEARDAGERGPIIGNAKIVGGSSSRNQGEHPSKPRPLPNRPAPSNDEDSQIPF